jgi:hypothetical protein
LTALARVETELGLAADARAHADAAVAIAEKLDPASAEAAHCFEAAGMAYADAARLRRARPGFERRYGARSPEVAELLGRIGAVELAAGQGAAARAALEEAFALAPAGLLPAARLALAQLDGAGPRALRLAGEARAGYAERHDLRGQAQAERLLARLSPPSR